MRLTIVLTMLVTLLGGCVTVVSDQRICPTIKAYTPEERVIMAAELEKAAPELQRMGVDYMKLRDQVRACRAR